MPKSVLRVTYSQLTVTALTAPAQNGKAEFNKGTCISYPAGNQVSTAPMEAVMLATLSQRLIQFKRIAVLTDLGNQSEKVVGYGASLARWYGSELLLVHAYPPELHLPVPPEPIPSWLASGLPPKQDAEQKLKSLLDKVDLQNVVMKVKIREATIGQVVRELDEYRPSLLLLGTHGREGIRKWLVGSIAEEVFRKVHWPVLILGPSVPQTQATPQKQFQRVLFGTDLSAASVMALH